MKLLFITNQYGDRVMIHPSYGGRMIFFAGEEQPQNQELVTVELPGLPENSEAAIFAWLDEQTAVPADSRRPLYELPAENWRGAVLEDILDAENYEYLGWWLHAHFPLADFSAFADKWLPPVQAQMRQALEVTGPKERADFLRQLHSLADRVFVAIAQVPECIERERAELIEGVEKSVVAQLRQEPFVVEQWIETAELLQTTDLAHNLLVEVTQTLARQRAGQAEIEAALTRIYQSSKLRPLTEYSRAFWNPLSHTFRLEPTVSDQTIDITTAQAQPVNWGWELFGGRRIGRIVPGRQALVISDAGSLTYIAGGRDIKFKVQQHGRLRRHGCTLIMDSTSNSLYEALLEMERLDILATLAPQEAVARVAHLNLPPDHAVHQTAAAVQQDPRQARVLADLLIELTVGIDADVARRLIRAQTGRTGR
ncbi:MAG: hypothetical protein R6X32_23255 [Chloroflexota bacterium]